MRRAAARAVLVLLAPAAAAFLVEAAARLAPSSAPTDSESALLWVAGTRPTFACAADGACRADPGLVALSNPDERFAALPAPGVFRVACVGDSTTAGWPYQPRGGYPEWLGAMLHDALPGRRSEVINLGIHAWDGARLEPVFDAALSLRPDVVVLRLGYDDYQHFLLRRPRGGPVARAAQRTRLFLLAHSAAFRLLSRGFGPVTRRGIVDVAASPLTDAEEDALIEAHRLRLRALAARARAAGTRVILLGLPHWAGYAPRYPALRAYDRLEAATGEEARALDVPFVPLTEFKTRERFVDIVHFDLEGYRLAALDVARALAAAGLGAPAARWRWDLIAPPAQMERRLGLDEPEYRAHLETSLARFALVHGDRASAARHMESALRIAPNSDLVPAEEAQGIPEMKALYRETFQRLAKAGRAAPPLQAGNRAMAGL